MHVDMYSIFGNFSERGYVREAFNFSEIAITTTAHRFHMSQQEILAQTSWHLPHRAAFFSEEGATGLR